MFENNVTDKMWLVFVCALFSFTGACSPRITCCLPSICGWVSLHFSAELHGTPNLARSYVPCDVALRRVDHVQTMSNTLMSSETRSWRSWRRRRTSKMPRSWRSMPTTTSCCFLAMADDLSISRKSNPTTSTMNVAFCGESSHGRFWKTANSLPSTIRRISHGTLWQPGRLERSSSGREAPHWSTSGNQG